MLNAALIASSFRNLNSSAGILSPPLALLATVLPKITASGPITSWEIDGETVETVSDFILGAQKSLQMVTAAMKLKEAYSLEEKL